jgi:acyl-CoA thioester hydrolase
MHTLPVTVYYEDTDMGGIVYHANFLKFVERGRSDWVREMGLDQRALRAAGLIFAVHRIEATFHAPARLDDRLTVTTAPHALTPARLVLDQTVRRDAATLFSARVTVVAMTPEGRPTRLPATLRAALAGAPDRGGPRAG